MSTKPTTVQLALRIWTLVDVEIDTTDPGKWRPVSAVLASPVSDDYLMSTVEERWSEIEPKIDEYLGADKPEVKA